MTADVVEREGVPAPSLPSLPEGWYAVEWYSIDGVTRQLGGFFGPFEDLSSVEDWGQDVFLADGDLMDLDYVAQDEASIYLQDNDWDRPTVTVTIPYDDSDGDTECVVLGEFALPPYTGEAR